MSENSPIETKPVSFKRGVPKSANNGLYGLEDWLIAHPEEQVVAVVTFGVEDVIHKEKAGERYPVVELLHIEPMREDAEIAAALRLLRDAATVRRGEQPELDLEPAVVEPPLDLERPLAEGPVDGAPANVTPLRGRAPGAEAGNVQVDE